MKELLSVEKAASLLGLSRWTVRSYERDGKIRAVRLGRRVMFREEDLERYVDDLVREQEQIEPQPERPHV